MPQGGRGHDVTGAEVAECVTKECVTRPPPVLAWLSLLLLASCWVLSSRLQRSVTSTCCNVCLSICRCVSAPHPRFYLGTWNMEGFMAEGRQVGPSCI